MTGRVATPRTEGAHLQLPGPRPRPHPRPSPALPGEAGWGPPHSAVLTLSLSYSSFIEIEFDHFMWTIKLFSVHSQTCAAVTQSPQKKPCTPQLRLSIHHPPSLRPAAAPPPAFGGGARGLWTSPHAATRLGRLCVCVFPDSASRLGAAGRLVPSARGGIDIRLQGQAAFHSATQHVVDLWASPRLGRYE